MKWIRARLLEFDSRGTMYRAPTNYAPRRGSNAEIRDRAGNPRRGQAHARRNPGHLAEVLRGAAHHAAGAVAAQLRHGRQDLLRVHRAEREGRARPRQPGRLPGESHLCRTPHDRPHLRRRLVAASELLLCSAEQVATALNRLIQPFVRLAGEADAATGIVGAMRGNKTTRKSEISSSRT